MNKTSLPNRVSVLGMGRTGMAVSIYLAKRGVNVYLSDIRKDEFSKELDKLSLYPGIKITLGEHNIEELKRSDLIVISPGIPFDLPFIKELCDDGFPVISEIELCYLLTDQPFIAITGTKGKSTTTALLYHILKTANVPAVLGGNIGTTLISVLPDTFEKTYIVCEVSSFQLEGCIRFSPFIGIFLNFFPDHLDRHNDMETYFALKSKLFLNQTSEQKALLNWGDKKIRGLSSLLRSSVFYFNFPHTLPYKEGVILKDDTFYYRFNGKDIAITDTSKVPLIGQHNWENIMASVEAALLLGVDIEVIKNAISSFLPLRHRLEFVAEINSVKYYNDSKSTTPESVKAAVRSFSKSVILIAGGRNKLKDISNFFTSIESRIKALFLIGELQEELYPLAKRAGLSIVKKCVTLKEAVEDATQLAEKGDIILFSPGGTSFDMFKNAEERGEAFLELVMSLKDVK